MKKPFTTLFMLESLDGRISTGDNDERDFDRDFKKIKGIKEGLFQYYAIEKTTDIVSLNSGRVMDKVGMNSNKPPIKNKFVSFIIIDNNHLTSKGIENFIKNTKKLYLVTTNKNHPALKIKHNNLEVIFYNNKIDFKDLFNKFKTKYKINRITIQSGGTLNSVLLRENLVDKVSIVIAPCLIGGTQTTSLVEGESLHSLNDLKKIRILKLEKCNILKNSYVNLIYSVR